MTTFDDFRVGDRVHHRSMGENGTVTTTKLRDGTDSVCVTYDRCTEHKSGQTVHWKGAYDRRWFEINQNLLLKGDTKMLPFGAGMDTDEHGNLVRRVGS